MATFTQRQIKRLPSIKVLRRTRGQTQDFDSAINADEKLPSPAVALQTKRSSRMLRVRKSMPSFASGKSKSSNIPPVPAMPTAIRTSVDKSHSPMQSPVINSEEDIEQLADDSGSPQIETSPFKGRNFSSLSLSALSRRRTDKSEAVSVADSQGASSTMSTSSRASRVAKASIRGIGNGLKTAFIPPSPAHYGVGGTQQVPIVWPSAYFVGI